MVKKLAECVEMFKGHMGWNKPEITVYGDFHPCDPLFDMTISTTNKRVFGASK